MSLRIVMHEAFPAGDVEAVRRVAREWDDQANVSATYATKALDPVLVVIMFIGAQFASGFLGKAGEDGWDALKSLISRMRTEMQRNSQFVIEDDAGLQLILGPDTPADALSHIPDDVREAAGEAGQLIWDETESRWRPPY